MNLIEITPTDISNDCCNTWENMNWNDWFQLDDFLEDHPGYRATLQSVGVPHDLGMSLAPSDAERLLIQRFAADFSTHHKGRIGIDLAHLLVPEAQESASRSCGYMFRKGLNHDQFHVAVTFWPEPELDLLDRATVLHEYGHYVEQRVAAKRRQSREPLADRSTSFNDALRFIRHFGDRPSSEYEMRRAADELVAWLNAIWLCWITSMDPRIVVVGMALDAFASVEPDIRFLERCIAAIAPIITDREVAQRFFSGLGLLTFENALSHRNRNSDVTLCKQIDYATVMLIRCLLVPRLFRWREA